MFKRYYCFLLTAIALLGCMAARSQPVTNRDQAEERILNAKQDTDKVNLLYTLGQEVEGSEPELAKHYYTRAYQLSKKAGYPLGQLKYYANYTAVLNMQGRFDSSLKLNLEAVDMATRLQNEERIAISLQNVASTYF